MHSSFFLCFILLLEFDYNFLFLFWLLGDIKKKKNIMHAPSIWIYQVSTVMSNVLKPGFLVEPVQWPGHGSTGTTLKNFLVLIFLHTYIWVSYLVNPLISINHVNHYQKPLIFLIGVPYFSCLFLRYFNIRYLSHTITMEIISSKDSLQFDWLK